MSRDWLLYASASEINEATAHYIQTILLAGRSLGRNTYHIESIAAIPWRADVVVVESKSAFKLRALRPDVRYWLWVQGIVPEEAMLQLGSRWREKLWTLFERTALPNANGVLMVSRAMQQHFAKKYGYTKLPSFVMPCSNAALDAASFEVPGKYDAPRFVYAGSMHAWQSFDVTLDVYRQVKAQYQRATLTVLTGDQAGARRAVAAAGATDVDIGFVPSSQLQAKLATFKYGFVIRARHVVNQVATPTKVSSYMAAGVIPVMTTAVDDYADRLRGVDPVVMSDAFDAPSIARAVCELEARKLDGTAVLESYRRVFADYFDHAGYGAALQAFLRATGLHPAPQPHVA